MHVAKLGVSLATQMMQKATLFEHLDSYSQAGFIKVYHNVYFHSLPLTPIEQTKKCRWTNPFLACINHNFFYL